MRGQKPATTDATDAAPTTELFDARPGLKPTQFLFPAELKDQLRERAHVERRSMSEIVREAVEQYLHQ